MSRAGVLALRRATKLHGLRFEQALYYDHGSPDARLKVYGQIATCETAKFETTTVKKGV